MHITIEGGAECLDVPSFISGVVYRKAEWYRCNAIPLSLTIHSVPPIFVPTLIRASNKNMTK